MQPLSHSARVAGAATQPLCQSGWRSHSATLPEWLEQPLSHSAILPQSLPEWLEQPLSHSARVAGAATQPLSHSATVAGGATQPLSHSEWLSGWVANVKISAIARSILYYIILYYIILCYIRLYYIIYLLYYIVYIKIRLNYIKLYYIILYIILYYIISYYIILYHIILYHIISYIYYGANTWPPKSTTRPWKVWRALIQPSRSWITTSNRQLTWHEPVHCSLALSSPRGTIWNSTERSSPFVRCVFYLTPTDTGFAAPGLLPKERNALIFCHGSMNCHCALRCTYWRQDHLLCCRWSATAKLWSCCRMTPSLMMEITKTFGNDLQLHWGRLTLIKLTFPGSLHMLTFLFVKPPMKSFWQLGTT